MRREGGGGGGGGGGRPVVGGCRGGQGRRGRCTGIAKRGRGGLWGTVHRSVG